MNIYLKTLIIMTMVCQVLLILTTEILGDRTKRSIRFLCGIVMLLTLFQPLKGFMENLSVKLEELPEKIPAAMETAGDEIRTQAVTESLYSYIAEEWMMYIAENYDVAKEQICVLLETNEGSDLISAEITLHNCPYVIRKSIEEDINKKTEIPVTIKGE